MNADIPDGNANSETDSVAKSDGDPIDQDASVGASPPGASKPAVLSVPMILVLSGVVALITLVIAIKTPWLKEIPIPDARDLQSGTGNRDADPNALSVAQQVAKARFFDTEVVPLIETVDGENRAAAERCLQRIDRVLQDYHTGVEDFVDDMTSVTTRLGVLKRMPGGWWAKDGRVESYVQDKFESHLFSEQSLVDDLSGALLAFREEVDANQLRMLTRVQAALSTADLPGVTLDQREAFFRSLSSQLGGYASGQGTTSVENMLGALVLGEVGAFAARSLIAGLLVRFVPSVAIGSAAGASATVGASATGAGGGAVGGPVGAVVGFGVGLAIGLVIDWWMTERFEAELSGQLHQFLFDLEATLISGAKTGENSTKSDRAGAAIDGDGGLEQALPRLCEQLSTAYRDRFYQQIVIGEP